MEAGDVWWEGELFRGNPNWNTLHSYGKPTLTAEEKDFIDNQVMTALTMIDDFDIVHNRRIYRQSCGNTLRRRFLRTDHSEEIWW